jgi:hypothetical protein
MVSRPWRRSVSPSSPTVDAVTRDPCTFLQLFALFFVVEGKFRGYQPRALGTDGSPGAFPGAGPYENVVVVGHTLRFSN